MSQKSKFFFRHSSVVVTDYTAAILSTESQKRAIQISPTVGEINLKKKKLS